jgi:proteasome lid subunit RPN8/RPN11
MAVRASSESNPTRGSPRKRVDGRKESNVDQPDLFKTQNPKRRRREPCEWKLIALRECPAPEAMHICDNPEIAVQYWRTHIATSPLHNPECECFAVLLLNTRRRIRGHHLVSIGTMDTVLVHPREVFRVAVVAGAAALVMMHNHPSGEATPSEADIKVTRDLIRAGQLIKIDVCDHVIVGHDRHTSLRELGYFYA